MASTYENARRDEVRVRSRSDVSTEDSIRSAVSWAAIIAGAVAATAATVILLVLGTGVGLSVVSPWYGAGASAATVGVSAVVWLVVVQWISSGLEGFLAGRLRTKWVGVHTHEVFFRDTAHGFLAWSLATVAGALVFASVTALGVGGAAKGTSDVAAAAASGAAQAGARRDTLVQATAQATLSIACSDRRRTLSTATKQLPARRQRVFCSEISRTVG
jgi:hypothetical protein